MRDWRRRGRADGAARGERGEERREDQRRWGRTASIFARRIVRAAIGAMATRSGASSPEIVEPGEAARELPRHHHQYRERAELNAPPPLEKPRHSRTAGGTR